MSPYYGKPYVKHQITGRHVRGDGPLPCDLLLVSDRPGREDDKLGIPMQGPPGRELDRYLFNVVGRHRSTVRVENLVYYAVESKDAGGAAPTKEEIAACEPEFAKNFSACNPTVVASLGRVATRYFLGPVDMEIVHGRPHTLDSGVVLVPCFSPAAGLHSTELQGKVAYDFLQLGLVMRGKIKNLHPEPDPYPEPEYGEVMFKSLPNVAEIAVDTEGSWRNPWGLSYSSKHGVAKVWRNSGLKVPESVESSSREEGTNKTKGQAVRGLQEGIPILSNGIRPRSGREGDDYGSHAASVSRRNSNRGGEMRRSLRNVPPNPGTRAGGTTPVGQISQRLILHNSMFDIDVLAAMGIEVPDDAFDDTMVMSYNLCIEPQGLKELARRHLGMEMQSYDEVLGKANYNKAIEYWEKLAEWLDNR